MTNIWFTSDLHFFHKNCVEFGERPCTPETQTEYLINTLKQYVKEGDTFYHLGDLSFGKSKQNEELIELLKPLNFNWKFLLGNHDEVNRLTHISNHLKGQMLGHYHECKLNDVNFIMCHYPIENWNKMYRGSVHLYGHLHRSQHSIRNDIPNRFNVCFDVEHRPFNLNEILELIKEVT